MWIDISYTVKTPGKLWKNTVTGETSTVDPQLELPEVTAPKKAKAKAKAKPTTPLIELSGG